MFLMFVAVARVSLPAIGNLFNLLATVRWLV